MMVMEDSCSLGSAISGQQSPEPNTDHGGVRPTPDETPTSGGSGGSGEKAMMSAGGVLTGGRVCGGGMMGVAKSIKSSRGRSSIFTISRGSRGCKESSCNNNSLAAGDDRGSTPPNPSAAAAAAAAAPPSTCTNPSEDSRLCRPVSYRRTEAKNGRRTTSLLNIFAASNNSSSSGKRCHGNHLSFSPSLCFFWTISDWRKVAFDALTSAFVSPTKVAAFFLFFSG